MNNRIEFKNSRPIFTTNFSGDPTRDYFGSSARKLSVIIQDKQLAMDMREDGFNIKETKPREGEDEGFTPEYFVNVNLNFNSKRPPKVYLISGKRQVLLTEETVGQLDEMRIKTINMILNPYQSDARATKTLYVSSMQVVQDLDDDPYAMEYNSYLYDKEQSLSGDDVDIEFEEVPFR